MVILLPSYILDVGSYPPISTCVSLVGPSDRSHSFASKHLLPSISFAPWISTPLRKEPSTSPGASDSSSASVPPLYHLYPNQRRSRSLSSIPTGMAEIPASTLLPQRKFSLFSRSTKHPEHQQATVSLSLPRVRPPPPPPELRPPERRATAPYHVTSGQDVRRNFDNVYEHPGDTQFLTVDWQHTLPRRRSENFSRPRTAAVKTSTPSIHANLDARTWPPRPAMEHSRAISSPIPLAGDPAARPVQPPAVLLYVPSRPPPPPPPPSFQAAPRSEKTRRKSSAADFLAAPGAVEDGQLKKGPLREVVSVVIGMEAAAYTAPREPLEGTLCVESVIDGAGHEPLLAFEEALAFPTEEADPAPPTAGGLGAGRKRAQTAGSSPLSRLAGMVK